MIVLAAAAITMALLAIAHKDQGPIRLSFGLIAMVCLIASAALA